MAHTFQNNMKETEIANVNARRLRRRAKANEQGFNVRAAAPAMKKKLVIYDMVLEHATWLQSLEVNVRSFRGRFGIECEDYVSLEAIWLQ